MTTRRVTPEKTQRAGAAHKQWLLTRGLTTRTEPQSDMEAGT